MRGKNVHVRFVVCGERLHSHSDTRFLAFMRRAWGGEYRGRLIKIEEELPEEGEQIIIFWLKSNDVVLLGIMENNAG